MKPILSEELIYEILSVVEEIPEGHVASYGQIAQLIGRERNSRLVGKVLSVADDYGDYPCHRVVNAKGFCSGSFAFGGPDVQRNKLEAEGVTFIEGHVDMQKHNITQEDFELISAELGKLK